MAEIKTNKADAARRHLDAAIRMLFNQEDPVAIYTVVAAAFRILRILAERSGDSQFHETIKQMIRPGQENEFLSVMNKMGDYLKQADHNPDELLDGVEEEVNDLTILGACMYYDSLGYQLTPEMRTFMVWFMTLHPELMADSVPFNAHLAGSGGEAIRNQSRQVQLEVGKQVLANTRGQNSSS
ncbi:MAG TPA: hypothetical protein VGQ60_02130 [Nitrospiraceae bacterium]|jgi:hypothetical protein|nr:hypothetical protein [Nitrospiraceae bacterium]